MIIQDNEISKEKINLFEMVKYKEMKYLVAVSGGVDSIVLLDMLAKRNASQLIVAHFDHGIRPDSAVDARFVENLALKYKIPFVVKREELGMNASEDVARQRRYAFLKGEANKHGATIVTAHHRNDLFETIAINIQRGTGWRGLAVFSDKAILRPLLEMSKDDLYTYAVNHRLEWQEDSTNASDVYLRNRIRKKLHRLPLVFEDNLERLWQRQSSLKGTIEKEASKFIPANEASRYLFIMIDPYVALEILRNVIVAQKNSSLQRPQLERALLAIKTARAGSIYQVGNGISLRFTTISFIVE